MRFSPVGSLPLFIAPEVIRMVDMEEELEEEEYIISSMECLRR